MTELERVGNTASTVTERLCVPRILSAHLDRIDDVKAMFPNVTLSRNTLDNDHEELVSTRPVDVSVFFFLPILRTLGNTIIDDCAPKNRVA